MRPIQLKGHERPLTTVKFNRESDLLFTVAKDRTACVWYANTGERLGTYNGHGGSIWDIDMNYDSSLLLTGSSDKTAKLWQLESGKELFSFTHESMVRAVSFAHGDRMILTAQDQSFSKIPTIFIYNVADDIAEQDAKPVREMKEDDMKTKQVSALWGPLNQTIVSAGEDGCVRVWDVEKGVQVAKVQAHKKQINNLKFSPDQTMFITASSDYTAKLYDAKSLQVLKTFQSDRPLNSASISPISNHVIVGGGQEAMNVTTTDARSGHFEVDFYHTVYAEKLDSVKGHFGPVNTVAFSPDGKCFASGAEDGYVRLYNLDKDWSKVTY